MSGSHHPPYYGYSRTPGCHLENFLSVFVYETQTTVELLQYPLNDVEKYFYFGTKVKSSTQVTRTTGSTKLFNI